jgi:hypothetical protein
MPRVESRSLGRVSRVKQRYDDLFPLPPSSSFRLTSTQYEDWASTLRYPTNQSPSASSQGSLVDAGLNPQTTSIRGATYKLLLNVTDYGVFSNDVYPGPQTEPATFQSIETIHNNIHVAVGRGGHMNVPDFAAFDPIFWLHHANVSGSITINLSRKTEHRKG